mmetsp:Transcript_8341/g.25770  ORF Transcript_8341/g.25770 Transcript_8341/m.25770 type:complete len:200 (+) Transcript_8341:130-729(+)
MLGSNETERGVEGRKKTIRFKDRTQPRQSAASLRQLAQRPQIRTSPAQKREEKEAEVNGERQLAASAPQPSQQPKKRANNKKQRRKVRVRRRKDARRTTIRIRHVARPSKDAEEEENMENNSRRRRRGKPEKCTAASLPSRHEKVQQCGLRRRCRCRTRRGASFGGGGVFRRLARRGSRWERCTRGRRARGWVWAWART